jgi:hypothetical protein
MIQEVPFATYIENSKNEMNECEKNKHIEQKEQTEDIETIPISIEVVPHKAILIYNANVHTQVVSRNNTMLTIYKCIFITFFSIPVFLVLISFFTRMP